MDIVLSVWDKYLLTPYVYPETWKEDYILRQALSVLFIINFGGYVLYLTTAAASYFILFDHRLKEHPQFLKNQVSLEITYACKSIPFMSIPTLACFMLEVRGYSKLYDGIGEKCGWWSILFEVTTMILFTDCLIYWIHRFLHHKRVYKHMHKDHHKWKVPSPFASHAFHPADGFLQSFPHHMYTFLFPLNKYTYLVMFVFVNFWTISIHDGYYAVPGPLKPFVNGSAHHMDHHVFYNYNYGQFFTLWDRIGGSFRTPSSWLGKGPMDDILKQKGLDDKNDDIIKKVM